MRLKNLIILILATGCIISFSSPVFAEFYRYKDENGVVRFTDNMLEVPEDQRKQVDRYVETISPDDNNAGQGNTDITDENAGTAAKKEGGSKASDVMYKEYMELQSERQALEGEVKEKKSKFTTEEFKAYNDRLKNYEKRLADYEKKREALEQIDAEIKAKKKAAIESVIKEKEE